MSRHVIAQAYSTEALHWTCLKKISSSRTGFETSQGRTNYILPMIDEPLSE